MAISLLVPFLAALPLAAPAPAPLQASMLTAPQADERPWIGVSLSEDEGREGLSVVAVLEGSPAAKAGLEAGDRILAFGRRDQGISTYDDLMEVLSGMRPGRGVGLWVARTLVLELDGEHRTAEGRPLMGIGVEDRDRGVFVTSVNEGFPAARAGLKKGDRLISVDGVVLGSGDALIELLAGREPGQELRTEIARGFEMKLGKAPAAPSRSMTEAGAAERRAQAEMEKAQAQARAEVEIAERRAQAELERAQAQARVEREQAERQARAEAERAERDARREAGRTPGRGRFVPIPVPEEGGARAGRTDRPDRPERAERAERAERDQPPAPPAAEATRDLRLELRRLAEELAAMRRELTQLRREFDALQRGRDR